MMQFEGITEKELLTTNSSSKVIIKKRGVAGDISTWGGFKSSGGQVSTRVSTLATQTKSSLSSSACRAKRSVLRYLKA
jgi:hypothetical protein